MLYLAQVNKEGILGQIALRLLAYQKPDKTWAVISEENANLDSGKVLSFPDNNTYESATHLLSCEGVLVLVELTDSHEIFSIQDATPWVLNLVQQYLTKSITPDFLQQEATIAEEWRQFLTLQSQELSRRSLEIEARREQIQALEERLQREKNLLEMMAAKLKSNPHQ